ncbi:hypothetical protein [Streptomyces sp. NPDC127038]|uniref:hypothetical protein n=1 Tax=Streptomyces sp. NPDC127038 TaxID=3347114 RepID=UPI00365AAAF1
MPGQRKRKRRQDAERQRIARRTARPGHWEVVFETYDQAELREHAIRLREAGVDGPMIRIDMLCGRLVQPTAYRLSHFVPDPTREPDSGHLDR